MPQPTSAPRNRSAAPTEAELVAAWASSQVEQPLLDSAGRRLQVVYPGRRSGLPGPDFRDAILAAEDGTLLRGDIELHLRAADWYRHRHDRDAAYNTVALHLVALGPLAPVRLASGAQVPSAIVRPRSPRPLVAAGLSGIVCPSGDRDAAAAAVDAAGDAWLAERALRLAGQIDLLGEDDAVWRALAEAMGYGGNGPGFLALAEALPWGYLSGMIGRGEEAIERVTALLLGAAGLARDGKERARWQELGAPAPLSPIRWTTTAVRPANQPAARIRALARLAVTCHGEGPASWLRRLAALPPRRAAAAIVAGAGGALGAERARTIVVNVALPLAVVDGTLTRFPSLPLLPENAITRAMSDLVFTPAGRRAVTGARRQQGLLYLYRRWCREKNCAACSLGQRLAGAMEAE
ncbi:MAG: DUF2851 family protein [Chloroflexota bacterium]|nr:DUF2851 family protein [Dehalococcoidia bacterium]MDW8252969.1 DUF2851 family protein [Chloroflexota bacterium]